MQPISRRRFLEEVQTAWRRWVWAYPVSALRIGHEKRWTNHRGRAGGHSETRREIRRIVVAYPQSRDKSPAMLSSTRYSA